MILKYSEWICAVPEEIRADTLWCMHAYRISLFLSDIAWHDVLKLDADRKIRGLAD